MNSIELPIYWKISTNEIYSSKSWHIRSQHKQNFRQAYVNKLKELPKSGNIVDISFDYQFKSRPYDSDNCGYMTKLLIDCLVTAKVIETDTPKHVGWVSMRSSKGKEDKVIITMI